MCSLYQLLAGTTDILDSLANKEEFKKICGDRFYQLLKKDLLDRLPPVSRNFLEFFIGDQADESKLWIAADVLADVDTDALRGARASMDMIRRNMPLIHDQKVDIDLPAIDGWAAVQGTLPFKTVWGIAMCVSLSVCAYKVWAATKDPQTLESIMRGNFIEAVESCRLELEVAFETNVAPPPPHVGDDASSASSEDPVCMCVNVAKYSANMGSWLERCSSAIVCQVIEDINAQRAELHGHCQSDTIKKLMDGVEGDGASPHSMSSLLVFAQSSQSKAIHTIYKSFELFRNSRALMLVRTFPLLERARVPLQSLDLDCEFAAKVVAAQTVVQAICRPLRKNETRAVLASRCRSHLENRCLENGTQLISLLPVALNMLLAKFAGEAACDTPRVT